MSQNENREYLQCIFLALQEKGYHPIGQIVGYLITEDPTYITSHNGARKLIRKIDREELLRDMVEFYIKDGHH